MGGLGRWEHNLQMFPKSTRLFNTTSELFARVLNYFVRAAGFYEESYLSTCHQNNLQRHSATDVAVHRAVHESWLDTHTSQTSKHPPRN